MKFILAKKEAMTQIFDEDGTVQPATVVIADPITVTEVKSKDRDGYEAVQFGFGKKKLKNINKPQRPRGGPFGGGLAYRRENKTASTEGIKTGDIFDISMFEEGDTVAVTGVSKGKGFQGVVKRHGFHGGPRSHGQKHSEREPGSIGSAGLQRVLKGMRMAGRMGSDRVTVKNLKIIKIDKENNKMFISGALPGRRGTALEIRG